MTIRAFFFGALLSLPIDTAVLLVTQALITGNHVLLAWVVIILLSGIYLGIAALLIFTVYGLDAIINRMDR